MCYKCALTERWPKTGVYASIVSVKKMCCCFVFVFFFHSFERDSTHTWATVCSATSEYNESEAACGNGSYAHTQSHPYRHAHTANIHMYSSSSSSSSSRIFPPSIRFAMYFSYVCFCISLVCTVMWLFCYMAKFPTEWFGIGTLLSAPLAAHVVRVAVCMFRMVYTQQHCANVFVSAYG